MKEGKREKESNKMISKKDRDTVDDEPQ